MAGARRSATGRRCTALPGTAARALLARGISPHTLERVFDPIVADLQAEWLAAATRREALRARLSGHLAIARAVGTLLALRLTRAIGESTLRFGLHLTLAAALTFAVFLVLASLTARPDPDLPRPRPDPELPDFHRSPRSTPTPGGAP